MSVAPDRLLPQRLEECSLFWGLPRTDVEALRSVAVTRWLRAHQSFVMTGQHDDRCYLVLDGGVVKEVRLTLDGREVVQQLRSRGELLNAHVAFGVRPAPVSIKTLQATTLLQIAGGDFRHLLSSHPRLMASVAEVLNEEALRAREEHSWLSTASATTRVMRRLVELTELCGRHTDDGILVPCTLSQEELGSWAIASRETVAKLFHDLRETGVIETGRRHLLVRDIRALRRSLVEQDTIGLPARLVVA